MERKRLQTPHDRFFKAMFSKVPVISNFINEYLFSGVRLAFDDSIPWTIKNDSVDGFLNEFRSDIVYRLFEKTKSHFIYLLLEHKSFPDRKTVIQLKHYINSIENDITDSEKYEGPIPVVIYHGRRKWNIPLKLNLDEAGSALNQHFSILEYILVDISHTPDDRIVGSPQLRMTLMALKYVKTRLLIKKIDSILVIIKEMIDEPDAGEYVESLLLYIDSAAASDFKDEVLEKVKRSIIIGDDKMSKIKEYFKEEGRKEGVKQGIEQGIKVRNEQIAINMLRKGEPGEKVALYTGLPAERIALLRKQLLK